MQRRTGDNGARRLDDSHSSQRASGIVPTAQGEAAAASDLIAALQTEPIPEGAQPREPGSRVYRYAGAGYQVIFEIDDLERIIRVLGIRQTGEGEE